MKKEDIYKDYKGYYRFKNTDKLVHRWVAYKYIYLKDKKVYRRRGNSAYLTTDSIEVEDLEFGYSAEKNLAKVVMKFGSQEELAYYF